jgi:hypothetical protein
LTEPQIKLVRRAVIVMTAVLIAGVALLIGRVIYLAQRGGTQAASAGMMTAPNQPVLPEVRLTLPAGSEIRQLSLSGTRLVVGHTQPSGGEAILVLDLASGAVVSRVIVERVK